MGALQLPTLYGGIPMCFSHRLLVAAVRKPAESLEAVGLVSVWGTACANACAQGSPFL